MGWNDPSGISVARGYDPKQTTPKFGATVELRYRKVSFGPPVLQQFWVLLANGPRRGEWRDVPVEMVE